LCIIRARLSIGSIGPLRCQVRSDWLIMVQTFTYRLLTISVDDGHPADLRVAEMLARVGLTATFYVPARNSERQVITSREVRELASHFEVGSHTMNHVELTRLSASSAREEIRSSKQWVEDTVSRPSIAFCYPRGKHNRAIASMVRAAGFAGARTVMLNSNHVPHNPFRWGVSTQAYSHSPAIQIRHALREGNIAGVRAYGRVFRFERRWDQHFRRALDSVDECGGIAHLFLHGWEIEDQNDWELLDSVLRAAASRTQMKCVTNGELFSQWCELTNSQQASSA
jgi:peptidoglycan-N-acetylglucosamine deacetylase